MADIMHHHYAQGPAEQTEISRKIVQGSEQICRECNFGRMWKAAFPHKAAEHLALATGQSVRACAYQLSGEQEVSTKSITALIIEAQKR